jgi:hypothetical protein
MPIYLFWSQKDVKVFGFTADARGTNLPAALAPWERNGDGTPIYTGPNESLDDLSASNKIVRAVQCDGFYLARSEAEAGRLSRPASRSVH